VQIELSVTSERAKARALAALARHGYTAASGPVLLAYPWAIQVMDVADGDEAHVFEVVAGVDPCAGTITVGTASTASSAGS
jgi:hypothetical protein